MSSPALSNGKGSRAPPQAGYGNGGIESIFQFDKLCDKITNSLKNLEFTRDMLKKLAESERQSSKVITAVLSGKHKSLRFSVVDQAIQSYWRKQESHRKHFADALLAKVVEPLDGFINGARDKKKKLQKENGRIQKAFIEHKKEATKLKQISLKEWQRLEEQIQRNESLKKQNKSQKMKDLRPWQEKCARAFAKYEEFMAKLNELEQESHAQACQIGELLHESQSYASERLSKHYNMTVATKKFCDDFIASNKSIVQSKSPPLADILWRWLSYPKNHQNHTLPCTSQEVYEKTDIGQGFKRRVEPDFQSSTFLKPPQSRSSTSPSQKPAAKAGQRKAAPSQTEAETQQNGASGKKKKSKKSKKKKDKDKNEPAAAAAAAPPADDWNVSFDGDDQTFGATAATSAVGAASFGFDDQFDSGDIFATNGADTNTNATASSKPAAVGDGQAQAVSAFDAGFDDNFGDFGDNTDLDIANEQDKTTTAAMNDGAGFADDWQGGFGGNDVFDSANGDAKADDDGDVDALFANSAANDVFFGNGTNGNANNNNNNTTTTAAAAVPSVDDGLFAATFGGGDNVDIFANGDGDKPSGDGAAAAAAGLFDEDFDDGDMVFPEFDINAKTPGGNKSQNTNTTLQQPVITAPVQSSPQPTQLTDIPQPIVSFDAPEPSRTFSGNDHDDNEQKYGASDKLDVDNPFGDDNVFGGDGDDGGGDGNFDDGTIDADNPFGMFDEPDENDGDANADNDGNDDDDFDPFS